MKTIHRMSSVALAMGLALGSAAALQVADFCVGNDTGMVNVSAAVGTPTHVIIGARATLDHDPATLHNVKATSLTAISVDEVVGLLSPLIHH